MNFRRRNLLVASTGIDSGTTNEGPIHIDDYLTIEALEDGLTASLSFNDCEYCIDGDGNWKTLAAGTTTEAINTGQTLSFRAELTPVSSKGIGTFTISNKCNLKGDCKSLLYGDEACHYTDGKSYSFYKLFTNCTTIITVSEKFLPNGMSVPQYCYAYMFYGCSGLVTVPSILVATFLHNNCYQYMFRGCTSLTVAPELPATTLANNCYEGMFYGCKALTTAPELPATSISKEACYKNMFYGCTSLTTAPALPATINTTYGGYCYSGMFRGCTKLTSAPKLESKTVAEYCYHNMFYGCTSLTTAPEISATSTRDYFCSGMFRGCTKLTSAPKLPATSSYTYSYCYEYMFYGCKALKVAPELPATDLGFYCYQYMFYGCTGLTTAPELPATTLVQGCYCNMFQKCSNLNYIKMLAKDGLSALYCLTMWVDGVSSTGAFIKNSATTSLPTGASGIPSGWTVLNNGDGSNINFPVTLVEGDNGQVGLDLLNYLFENYSVGDEFTEEIYFRGTSYSTFDGRITGIVFSGDDYLVLSLQNNLDAANITLYPTGVVELNIYG